MATALERWWLRALVGAALLCLVLVIAIVLVDYAGSATDKRIAITFMINLILAVGLQTFVGNSGVVSFAHIGFMAIGAYGAALLTTPTLIKQTSIPDAPRIIIDTELSFLPATAIAVIVTMAVALVVGIAVVRLSGAAAAVATLGVLVIVQSVLSNADAVTRGSKAFYGIPPHTTLFVALPFAGAAIVLARLLRESGPGLTLRGSREDELAARASGVDVHRSRLLMWVASAGLAAVAGSLYAHNIGAILPHAFYFDLTFLIVTMVIVGGSGVSGAFVGAATLTVLTEFLRRAENGFSLGPLSPDSAPGLTTIVLGLLIVATMIKRPAGLLGRWEVDELLVRVLGRTSAVAKTGPAPATMRTPVGAVPGPTEQRRES